RSKDNFIFHHIGDSHEWHFATIGKAHITLPLPIIIISKERGIEIFSSNRFLNKNHESVSYKGYMLNKHDKIISIDNSHIFYDLSITKNIACMIVSILILLLVMIPAAK